MGLLQRPPFKQLYLFIELLTTSLIRVPYWFLADLIPAFRPVSSWSLRKCLKVRFFRRAAYLNEVLGGIQPLPNHLEIAHGRNVKGVWVDPAPLNLIISNLKIWSHVSSVEPISVPGYWLHKHTEVNVGAPPMPGEKVIYFLHGGGYHTCSAHPSDSTANITNGFLREGVSDSLQRAFSIEYRLTTTERNEAGDRLVSVNPFPAALLDALSGYAYLVQRVGFSPDNIVVMGDSAGGNLALALVRYLVDHEPELGQSLSKPGHLVLLSPWTDLGLSHRSSPSTDSYYTSQHTDFITDGKNAKETAFVGPHGLGAAEWNPYISPASKNPGMTGISYRAFPRTFIACGGVEMLRDQIRTMARKIEEVEAGCEYVEFPGAVHDWIVLGFEPETGDSLRVIGKWIDNWG